jgi:hypothetical protein
LRRDRIMSHRVPLSSTGSPVVERALPVRRIIHEVVHLLVCNKAVTVMFNLLKKGRGPVCQNTSALWGRWNSLKLGLGSKSNLPVSSKLSQQFVGARIELPKRCPQLRTVVTQQ